jgi:hypothetical protein
MLGSIHAAVDTLLFISIKKVFGTLIAFLFFVFSVWSPGNFIAATGTFFFLCLYLVLIF